MTHEQHKAAIKKAYSNIEKAEDYLELAKDNYLKQHAKYKKGEKIEVVQNSTHLGSKVDVVFIRAVFVNYKHEIKYSFYKSKKDGTPSKHIARYYNDITLRNIT